MSVMRGGVHVCKGRVTTSPKDIPYGHDRICSAVEQEPLAMPED